MPDHSDKPSQPQYQSMRATHLPTLTENLASIRTTAELAANQILDSAEAIQRLADLVESSDNLGGQIQAELLKIVQACSFQDLTGQRLTRIVDSIETIERSVNEILVAMGDREAAKRYEALQQRTSHSAQAADIPLSLEEDDSVADKQAEIDKMFSS